MTTKFRPVFSAQEVEILDIVVKEAYMKVYTNPDKSLIYEQGLFGVMTKIATYKSKIDNQTLKPAYIEKRKPSQQEQALDMLVELGGNPPDIPNPGISKEERWAAAHAKYELKGASACSVGELNDVQEHRYLNGLMSPEEVSKFEAVLIGEG